MLLLGIYSKRLKKKPVSIEQKLLKKIQLGIRKVKPRYIGTISYYMLTAFGKEISILGTRTKF